jgi:branched-subunit amino acid permease
MLYASCKVSAGRGYTARRMPPRREFAASDRLWHLSQVTTLALGVSCELLNCHRVALACLNTEVQLLTSGYSMKTAPYSTNPTVC